MEFRESSRERHLLEYDSQVWDEISVEPVNSLQLFITNKCNLRCKGCFYKKRLGKDEMSFLDYKEHIEKYLPEIQKIILLGGEPTIHPDLDKMLDFNRSLGLRSTIYTNGFDLRKIENTNLRDVSIRIGVYGSRLSEKPISKVDDTSLPVDLVYMLRKGNESELMETAEIAEKKFNCRGFYISSIRDIDVTGSFWKDTAETLTMEEYAGVVQNFVKNYKGNIPVLHIARRGVLYTATTEKYAKAVDRCRFGNIFPDNQMIICPFDISRNITSKELAFDKRKCNKHSECILRKIVLKKKA
jgi:hypothetical protein